MTNLIVMIFDKNVQFMVMNKFILYDYIKVLCYTRISLMNFSMHSTFILNF